MAKSSGRDAYRRHVNSSDMLQLLEHRFDTSGLVTGTEVLENRIGLIEQLPRDAVATLGMSKFRLCDQGPREIVSCSCAVENS